MDTVNAVVPFVTLLEHQIRRDVLQELLAELYQRNITDAISVREWLEAKLREVDDQPQGTESL